MIVLRNVPGRSGYPYTVSLYNVGTGFGDRGLGCVVIVLSSSVHALGDVQTPRREFRSRRLELPVVRNRPARLYQPRYSLQLMWEDTVPMGRSTVERGRDPVHMLTL